MRVIASMLAFSLVACAMFAQAPATTAPQVKDKPKDKPKVDKPVKLPPSPLDQVEGYKRQLIEGFTVMVSTEAGEGEIKGAEVKPLEALSLEFKTLKRLMPAKQIELFQKIPVWVEWDEYQPMEAGREGRATASYSWGSQFAQMQLKKMGYKSKCVTVHSLKLLAENHQPNSENPSLVLLREYAHAVHDQQLGVDHAGIKAGYRQAMERKLYDRAQLICLRDASYFGEVTCAYFDQLHHYPKTRDELKKHDPASHQLLESIWGAAKKPVKISTLPTKPKSLADLNGSDKFELKIALADIVLGATAGGPEFKTEDGKDCVVILANFGGDELLILEKLAKLHEELSPYGAKIVVAHTPALDADAVKKKLEDRRIVYSGLASALFPQKTGGPKAEQPGHAAIFNAEGKCVFRGSGYEATAHARAAVAKMLVAKAIDGEAPKALAPVVELLAKGTQPILELLPKVGALTTNGDPETAAAAKALATAILAPAQAQLAEAQSQVKSDPLVAYNAADKLAQTYKGASVATKAAAIMEQLKPNPLIAKELKARKLFDSMKKLDEYLMAQSGSNDALSEGFQRPHKGIIDQLVALNGQLKKSYPLAVCTGEAAKITAKYSLLD